MSLFIVHLPTLPFNSVMVELVSPEGGVPASKGTVPVCAAAATAIIVNPSQANTPFVIVQSLSIFHRSMRAQNRVHARFIFHGVKGGAAPSMRKCCEDACYV
jgi:hypothetical protein